MQRSTLLHACTEKTLATFIVRIPFLAFLFMSLTCLPQDTWCQPQGYPLQKPLTPLEPEDARTALEIYKLVF